ncbi:MAG: hypothetical protein KDA38_13100, partial [Planctomycetales bacterium]|nr:hypothetical protein [Planctomycetales bacterium]
MTKSLRNTVARQKKSRQNVATRGRSTRPASDESTVVGDVADFDDDSDDSSETDSLDDQFDDESDEFDVDLDAMDHTDDPVRMYLMQMGQIPLLNRDEEIKSAKQIERTRIYFRNTMLATDYVLQGAVEALELVRDGKLRLDRTIEVSVTNAVEKKAIMRRIGPNVATLRELLVRNNRDYFIAISKSRPLAERRAAWRRLVRRRYRAVRLVEELNLRINRLQPLFDRLSEISDRMTTLKAQIRDAERGTCIPGTTLNELRHELRYLMRITLESPQTLANRIGRTLKYQEDYDAAKRVLSAGNLRLVVSIAKKYR